MGHRGRVLVLALAVVATAAASVVGPGRARVGTVASRPVGAASPNVRTSRALPSYSARPSATFFTDGTVLAAAAASDKVYVGGSFTLIGRPTGSWVAVDGRGAAVAGRPQLAGSVAAAVPDGRGGWFVAGTIRGVGAVARAASVVHLRSDGQLDKNWRVAVRGGHVRALARRAQTLFLAGDFDSVGGKPRRGLAAVSSRGGGVLSWHLRGPPQIIAKGRRPAPGGLSTIALAGNALYVAGSFNRVGGLKRAGLAGVSISTGRVNGWNPTPNGDVETITPGSGGRTVYIGGDFTRIGGAARNSLAAVDTARGKAVLFNAHAPPYTAISAIAATRAAVYVAGDFSSLGDKSRHLVAALDPRSGTVTDWEPTISGDGVTSLALDARGTTVYLGGDLNQVDGQRRDQLAAVDAGTGAATAWDPPTLGVIAVLATDAQGTVFVGGNIAFVGGLRRSGLASVGADGSITDWDPALEGTVRALALSTDSSRLYVGGAFAPGDAPTQRNLAVVDLTRGSLHSFGGGTNSGVWVIAPTANGSTVYIGGAFVTVRAARRSHLAALDANTGELLPWNSGANDLVRALVATGDALYAGGDFSSAGGLARRRLVELDAETGRALGWNPAADDNVWALALRNDVLYVGGEFGQIGGRSRNALAAVDAESGEATSWDPNADGTVRALRVSLDRTKLLAAGRFEKIGGTRRGYAEFSVPEGSLTAWDPAEAFDGYSVTIDPSGSTLVIGGDGGIDVFR